MNKTDCPVDHAERRAMGLLACYGCGRDIQTIGEANGVRQELGMTHLYDVDRVLKRAALVALNICPMCNGRGYLVKAPAINP